MSGKMWETGQIHVHGGKVYFFENEGIVWYDAVEQIAKIGWQDALDELDLYAFRLEGLPFDNKFVVEMREGLAKEDLEKRNLFARVRGDG